MPSLLPRAVRTFALASSLALVALASPRDANACGGCLHGPSDTVTAVTSHRMVVAIHADESILWDQIRYSGNPGDFAWVLPVWGDVQVELATADFFDTLDADTNVSVQAPFVNLSCPGSGGGGFGCGASLGAPDRASSDASAGADAGHVTILHEMVVGPYETVTLRGTDANSLTNWLATNSYVVPPSIQPVVQYYVDHGMDFIALRLRPGQGVQAMQPVRVRYRTANMVLPLRMVAAGVTDKVGITLWVFGNGRYEPANFGSGEVLRSDVVWNWDTSTSNYRDVFDSTITRLGGRAWITEFSNSAAGMRQPDSTDGRADFALATGSAGMTFPATTMTVTRLRTNLAANFLDADLQLQAATDGSSVSNVIQATRTSGTTPTAVCGNIALLPRDDSFLRRPGRTVLGAFASVLAILVTRRKQRARKTPK